MVNRCLVIFSGMPGLLNSASSMLESERCSHQVNVSAPGLSEYLMNLGREGAGTFSCLESFTARSHWLAVSHVVMCPFPCFSQRAPTGARRQPGGVGWGGVGGGRGVPEGGDIYACG